MRAQTRKYRTESRPHLGLPPAPETRVCRGSTRNSSRNRLRRRYFPDTSSSTHGSVRLSTRRVACRQPYGDGPKACKFRTRTNAGRRHPPVPSLAQFPTLPESPLDRREDSHEDALDRAHHAGARHAAPAVNEAYGGTYSFSGTMVDSGVRVPQDSKYVATHERQADGSWKIVRDIWNANAAFGMAMDEEEE